MQDRNGAAGYLSELSFTNRFHRELAPSWLNYVAMLNRHQPRNILQPFTYLDLGCGFAQSTIIHAATMPHGEFHACDFNLAHIDAARAQAKGMQVSNVTFHACTFADLLDDSNLPAFDFIVLHGIYSWVDADVIGTIHELVSKLLRPGGLLYLSYNCYPGWAAEEPLRKLMNELAHVSAGDMAEKVRWSLQEARSMSIPSFRYFRDNAGLQDSVESLSKDPLNYVAHEFFNETWKLHYSVDVLDTMQGLGLNYVGSATLADNHPMLIMDQLAAERIASLPTPRLRHLAEDFAVNRRFRRDVFVRDGCPAGQGAQVNLIDEAIIGMVPGRETLDARVEVPRGRLSFQQHFIDDLRLLLAGGPMRLGDILSRLGGSARSSAEIRQNLSFLVAAGALMPFSRVRGEC